MSSLHQIAIGKDLPHQEGWRKLLESWFQVMTDFITATEQSHGGHDLPYWYNESSNKGFLAAAVWKMGGVTIQEYTVDKTALDQTTGRYPGRCDLWIRLPALGMEYAIEAKFGWVLGAEGAENRRRDLVSQAETQILAYDPTKRKDCPHMSAVFLSPYKQSAGDAEDLLKEIFQTFSQPMDSRSCCAVYYAPLGSKTDHVWKDGVRYYYPGVVLFVRLQGNPAVPNDGRVTFSRA